MRHGQSSLRAFTLIEVLVVMAIIGLLAALILPTLGRSKSAALAVKCKSNLKQIQLGMSGYVNDTDHYPINTAFRGLPPEIQIVSYVDTIKPYTSHGWKDRLYLCPSYKGSTVEFSTNGSVVIAPLGSYGHNTFGVQWSMLNSVNPDPVNYGLGGDFKSIPPPFQKFTVTEWRADAVKVPAEMIAVGDGFHSCYSQTQSKYRVESNGGLIYLSGDDWDAIQRGTASRNGAGNQHENPADRHGGRLNVSFCDGHVEGFGYRRLFLENSQEIVRKWNRDHLPHLDGIPQQ